MADFPEHVERAEVMGGSEYDETLEFIRHELSYLAGARSLNGLRPSDQIRYLDLGRKEKALLAERNGWPVPAPGGRR